MYMSSKKGINNKLNRNKDFFNSIDNELNNDDDNDNDNDNNIETNIIHIKKDIKDMKNKLDILIKILSNNKLCSLSNNDYINTELLFDRLSEEADNANLTNESNQIVSSEESNKIVSSEEYEAVNNLSSSEEDIDEDNGIDDTTINYSNTTD
jgi:hypothetical protein